MSYQIGSNPIDENTQCYLKFHQWTIYDSENWTQSGHLYWNATTKNFEVIPDTPLSSLSSQGSGLNQGSNLMNQGNEIITNNIPVNSSKNIKPVIPRKK